MKKVILIGALLVTTVRFNTYGQVTNSRSGAGNGTTPSSSQNGLSGTSGKNSTAVSGSSKMGGGKTGNRSMSSSTVDGSTNGSATNDGASGQSGSPIANQSAAIDNPQGKATRKLKTGTRKISGHSSSSNSQSANQ